MSINLLKLITSEDISVIVDKINQNFDIIAANGGGPQGSIGEPGPTGLVGPPGGLGPSGGSGVQGSIWMYSTEVPAIVNENNTPDVYDSISPSTPRKGDFLVLTKRDDTYSEIYRYETTTTSPNAPLWNPVVELNTQKNLYLKLDIFRFNDFVRNFPSTTTYKSIAYEDNTNANNFQNRLYLQNRKDYLSFSGNNLQSAQTLTNFEKVTIDKLLAKDEYNDTVLPKGKLNILSEDNHITFLYFKDQLDSEIITYPGSGDTIVSDTFNTNDPLNKIAFNGQWANMKMTQQGTLIFESTGDIQVNPRTNNQPNGKFSIFGKTLILQGSTIIDQTFGYVAPTLLDNLSGNTLALPLNSYHATANPNGQTELAIYPKTVDPTTSNKPLLLAFNNTGGFNATSNFSGLNTAQKGKENMGYLDANLDKLGQSITLSATNRKILVGGGSNSTIFGYDFLKLQDIAVPEKDRSNVFTKRNKLETITNVSTLNTVTDIYDTAGLPNISSGPYIAQSAVTDLYGRILGAIITDNSANIFNFTNTLSNDLLINRLYIVKSQTDDPLLTIDALVGLKITIINNTGKNLIFKRFSGTDGVLTSGKWTNSISQNPNDSTNILPGYDIITVKSGDKAIFTVKSITSASAQYCACECFLDSISSHITPYDSNIQTGLTFKQPKVYTLINQPGQPYTTAADKEALYKNQRQLFSGIYTTMHASYDPTLYLTAESDTFVLRYTSITYGAIPRIDRVNFTRLGPNLSNGTVIKLRLENNFIATQPYGGYGYLIRLVKESALSTTSINTDGAIVVSDTVFNIIKTHLTTGVNAREWTRVDAGTTAETTYVNFISSRTTAEIQLQYKDGYTANGVLVSKPHFVLVNHDIIVGSIVSYLDELNTTITDNYTTLLNRFDSIRPKLRFYNISNVNVPPRNINNPNYLIWTYSESISRECKIIINVNGSAKPIGGGTTQYYQTSIGIYVNGALRAITINNDQGYTGNTTNVLNATITCNTGDIITIGTGAELYAGTIQTSIGSLFNNININVNEIYEYI